MSILARRYMPIRAAALALIGAGVIIAVVASKPVAFQRVDRAAPELKGAQWLNTPVPVTLASRKGSITLIEFFAYQCINCRHNVAPVSRLYAKFKKSGLEFIGVHTPELPDERNPAKVEKFLHDKKIEFPVLLDNDSVNWDRWKQEYWPTVYLVDRRGRIRFQWIGELDPNDEAAVEKAISSLLSEG